MSSSSPARPLVPETFSTRLIEAAPLGPRVRRLVFERLDGVPFQFEPGQWVQLVLPLVDEKGRALRRSYSIAAAPQGPRIELAVTRVEGGQGSTFLYQAEPGLTLDIKGPAGTFTVPPEQAAPALFVATGSGVAPFRAMLQHAEATGRTSPVWLLFGARSPDETLFAEEFRALASRCPWFRFMPSLSRAPESWAGRTGYVQHHVAAVWRELDAHGPPEAWVCGVKKMLTAVREVLRVDLGVDRKRVHLEAYD